MWAAAAASGVALAAVGTWLVFPGALRRPSRMGVSDAAFWAEACLCVAAQGSYAKSTGLYRFLELDSVAADGEIRGRLRLDPELQDPAQMMHMGAAALVVRSRARVCVPLQG